LLQVAMQTGGRPPAVLCAETTELKGDLGIDPYPKLICVTDTGFELVNDLWARFVPTRSDRRVRMRSRILTHQIDLFRLLNRRTCSRKSLCLRAVRERTKGWEACSHEWDMWPSLL
jgi:hypothetical protein